MYIDASVRFFFSVWITIQVDKTLDLKDQAKKRQGEGVESKLNRLFIIAANLITMESSN